ncbi:radical SAM protein [Sphaerisporangium sp. TRM90804]|uniref:radical SAM protein n=1 Tax=Sphaerisporangium sp. TRM90804 TaxID=3031113 RepID=UPI002448F456|nr:radical SAM protein [Sphaerisporangium sp. TRM90804]MDH2424703.1 radical SAM protein [Sphaerisporangium sp. TRM90804]
MVTTDFLWLEITGKCQLSCTHCYADSGPSGTHGTMRLPDWVDAIDQAAAMGTRMVQFIGGEPILHPDLPALVSHAVDADLRVEVYSNLVHVPDSMWEVFRHPQVQLATSFYTLDPAVHAQITGRNTMTRTLSNIRKARSYEIPLRVGLIDVVDGQRIEDAKAVLSQFGVTDVGVDRMRLLGRPARTACDASELCGRCGDGVAAILPDGTVTPCPLSRWLSAGRLPTTPLAELAARARDIAEREIMPALPHACRPPCEPQCNPGCDPSMTSPGGGDGCRPAQNCNPNQQCKPQVNPCKPDVSCRP